MMKHSWQNYKYQAWGKNLLAPLNRRRSYNFFRDSNLGETIVQGLDTLYIMGLDQEYKEGRDWIERNFSFDNISQNFYVSETNTYFIGGLLTLYAFTGENMYKEKAQSIAEKLLPAFDSPTGIPYGQVNPTTGIRLFKDWQLDRNSMLSDVGSLHLEFSYLSDVTGNPIYRQRVQTIRKVLKDNEKPRGLYPIDLSPKTGQWRSNHMSLGCFGDIFYEYLLKAWLQSGKADKEAREMFDTAMVSIIDEMVRTSPNGLTYVSDMVDFKLSHVMEHDACFSGGLFALGASTSQNQNSEKFMKVGKGITNTCHESYIRTATKLGPDFFQFIDGVEARASEYDESPFLLKSETVESYFILWRLTHDQKYRDWGWEVVQAIEQYCRGFGYTGIKNVNDDTSKIDNIQPSHFLAATLKYLYLLFSDDSLLPLDQWVFNTEGHPLPIRGANKFYRQATRTLTANVSSSS